MRHGAARLEAAQRAAGVPAALGLFEEAGRALLLLAYRHRMPDSEIALRLGVDPGLVAALREEQLARLVTATGATSREAVITWLEFVPEVGLVAGGTGAALEPLPRDSERGDVWREAKVMLAVLAALLVLYSAAEFDPGSRPAAVPTDRPPAAARVAVVPGGAAERPAGAASSRASGHAGRAARARAGAAGAPAAVRAPAAPTGAVRVASVSAAGGGGLSRHHASRGSSGLAGVTTTRPAPQPHAPPPTPSPGESGGGAVVARPGGPAGPRPEQHSGAAPGRRDGGPPGLRGGGPPGLRGGGPPGLRGGGPPGLRGGGPPGLRGGGPPGLRGGGPPGHRR